MKNSTSVTKFLPIKGRGHVPREILKVKFSEIAGNVFISIHSHKSLLNFVLQNKSLLVKGHVTFVA